MSDSLTVSIITPCYNGGRYLQQTLDSAARQTRPPLEVIVIDDGSTDDSAAIARAFGPPVRLVQQANAGESVARNLGISQARGSHALFLDADDVLHERAIEFAVEALTSAALARSAESVACMGFVPFTDGLPPSGDPVMSVATRFFPTVISGNLAPPSCWLTPLSLIKRAGCFLPSERYFEDWDLWWRVGLLDPPILPVAVVGFYYRQHPSSQLATVGNAERALGHARLMHRMSTALLDRDDLLMSYGDQLFWSSVTAYRACRGFGVRQADVRFLSAVIERIARFRPASLSRSQFARAVRQAGLPVAEWIFRRRERSDFAPSYGRSAS